MTCCINLELQLLFSGPEEHGKSLELIYSQVHKLCEVPGDEVKRIIISLVCLLF